MITNKKIKISSLVLFVVVSLFPFVSFCFIHSFFSLKRLHSLKPIKQWCLESGVAKAFKKMLLFAKLERRSLLSSLCWSMMVLPLPLFSPFLLLSFLSFSPSLNRLFLYIYIYISFRFSFLVAAIISEPNLIRSFFPPELPSNLHIIPWMVSFLNNN